MPHAENENGQTNGATMTEKPTVNGEKPSSQFISHLASYPVISDSINLYKSNPYGAKSLSFAGSVYSTAEKNLYQPLSPYLRGPYAYVAPYLAKADSLGDSSLATLESRFPIVKEDTETVKTKVISTAQLPIRIPFDLAQQGKAYLFGVYDEEYSKTQGAGLVKQAKAAISTELRVTVDVLTYVRSILVKKGEQAKEVYEKKVNNATG